MKRIFLTFDVEEFDLPKDYGREMDENEMFEVGFNGLKRVIEILEDKNVVGTFFLSAKFAKKYPDFIKKISEKHEIAVHCLEHGDIYEKMGDEKAFERIKEAKKIIEDIIGKEVKGFRAPRFFPPSNETLKRLGFEYDSSLLPTFIPLSRTYTLGKFKNLFKKRKVFVDKLKIIPVTVMPFIRIPFLWIIFRNFSLSYAKMNTRLGMIGTGFMNLVMHPWEFVRLDYDVPGLIKRNTGKKMCTKLENYIDWCKRKNYSFDVLVNS